MSFKLAVKTKLADVKTLNIIIISLAGSELQLLRCSYAQEFVFFENTRLLGKEWNI